VELNTIASSFGCLSTLMTRLHRHVLGRAGIPGLDLARLPEQNAIANIAEAIAGGGCAAVCKLSLQRPVHEAAQRSWHRKRDAIP
jgi:hypothetical protein